MVARLLPLLAVIALASATIGFGDCPYCLPVAIHDAPGVGFDLAAGYGVSSVNIYNGTTKDLVKLDAPQEYRDLFVRLSSASKPQSQSLITSLKRWLNKKRGLPSTEDVGVLSGFIARLKNATEAELGVSLNKIVLTHPRFTALTAKDIGDAIEYAGMESWLHVREENRGPDQLSEIRAAFAANGMNLCQEMGSWEFCIEKMSLMGPGTVSVYFASLSNSALYTSLSYIEQPFERDEAGLEPHLFDSKLGLDRITEYPSNESFWAAVRNKLVPRDVDVKYPISYVVIGGEAAMMPEFRAALYDALANVTFREGFNSTMERAFTKRVSPLYAAARGAALLARWRQESPMGCWEATDCAQRRKHERDGTPYRPKDPPDVVWDYSFTLENEEYLKYYREWEREECSSFSEGLGLLDDPENDPWNNESYEEFRLEWSDGK